MERIELKRPFLTKVFGSNAPDVGEWVWVNVSAVVSEGSVQPTSDALPQSGIRAMQKTMIDAMWETPLAALAEFVSNSGRDLMEQKVSCGARS